MKREESKEIPVWLRTMLSTADADRIEAAVRAAEAKTSAEIVPMVVHRSTLKATGDRILFWVCFALFGVGGALGFSFFGGWDEALLERVLSTFDIWLTSETHGIFSFLTESVVALAAFWIAGLVAKILARFDGAHRMAFPVADLTLEAEHRAQNEFYSSDLRSTSGRTGILLFVSVLERRAVILADDAIVAKIDRNVWTKTLDDLLQSIRAGRMADGYVNAIAAIADVLAPVFPAKREDRNELSDRLRIEA